MTWEEIERRIDRGLLSEEEEYPLWECLYLTGEQIAEVLDHVKEAAKHPFIHAMFVFAAHTGARRSEILRSQIDDFKFDDGIVQIRAKKKSRDKRITFRHVDMSPMLVKVMQDWCEKHPGGKYTIAAPTTMLRGKRRGPQTPLTPHEARDHFKRTLADSKWAKIRGFHVFRHSLASNLACAGVPEAIIDAWMGHQTEEMRRRYRHLFPAQRRSWRSREHDRGKPTRADEKVIAGNTFAGHREADIVLAGTDTRCEDNAGAVIRRSHPATGVKDADCAWVRLAF